MIMDLRRFSLGVGHQPWFSISTGRFYSWSAAQTAPLSLAAASSFLDSWYTQTAVRGTGEWIPVFLVVFALVFKESRLLGCPQLSQDPNPPS